MPTFDYCFCTLVFCLGHLGQRDNARGYWLVAVPAPFLPLGHLGQINKLSYFVPAVPVRFYCLGQCLALAAYGLSQLSQLSQCF